MRASASWAIDSEPIRARGIIFKYVHFTVDRRQKQGYSYAN